jgi:putative long chain acyl-CoA synthase
MVAYGLHTRGGTVLAAAVTLCEGAELTAADLDLAMDRLPASHRPAYVQVVKSIPVTTWHRPMWRPLQRGGVPRPSRNRQVFRLSEDRTHYQQL